KVSGRLRDVRVAGNEPAQRPVHRLRDADTRRHGHLAIVNGRARSDDERRLVERMPIVLAVDAERETELARAIREVHVAPRARAPRAHQLDAAHWFHGANEHRARRAFGARDGIEAPVHAVDEIDVGDAWGAVERRSARCAARGGVAGEVVLADVRLGLDDAAGGDAVGRSAFEYRTEQLTRDLLGGAVVEIARERRRAGTPRSKRGAPAHSSADAGVAFLPRARPADFLAVARPRLAGFSISAAGACAAAFSAGAARPRPRVRAGGAAEAPFPRAPLGADAGASTSTTPIESSSGGGAPGRAPRPTAPRAPARPPPPRGPMPRRVVAAAGVAGFEAAIACSSRLASCSATDSASAAGATSKSSPRRRRSINPASWASLRMRMNIRSLRLSESRPRSWRARRRTSLARTGVSPGDRSSSVRRTRSNASARVNRSPDAPGAAAAGVAPAAGDGGS